MKCLRSLVGVSRLDRVRNEDVRKSAGIERELESRADRRVLRWFVYMCSEFGNFISVWKIRTKNLLLNTRTRVHDCLLYLKLVEYLLNK